MSNSPSSSTRESKYDYAAKFILYGEHDSRIEVTEDGDGLGLVEIRQYEGEKMVARVSMHQDGVPMLQKALGQLVAVLTQGDDEHR